MLLMGAGAPMSGNGEAHVENDAHHLSLVPEVSQDTSASDKLHCSGASTVVHTNLSRRH